MYPKSGYLCLTATQLSNVVVLLNSGMISLLDARVYLGGLELAERREVARRVRAIAGDRAEKPARYSVHEFVSLTNEERLVRLKRAIKRLGGVGILGVREDRIEATRAALFPEDPLCLELKKRGALSRLVPIPRRLLTELCRESRKSVFLAKLAYVLRGLTLDRQTGELRGRGCIKASWIARYFRLSIRAVRLARSLLISSGFISRDVASFQRKLNRDGSYFEIDLSRYAATAEDLSECAGSLVEHCAGILTNCEHALKKQRKNKGVVSLPAHSNTDSAGILTSNSEEASNGQGVFAVPPTRFAPLSHENSRGFAPPRERQETPYGSKDQKTRFDRPNSGRTPSGAGVLGTELSEVSLRNIQTEDLRRVSTLRILFRQAVAANWVAPSESHFQNFVAAAVRATRLPADAMRSDPVRVFVGIVRKKLWNHITAEQEERARAVISRFREKSRAVIDPNSQGAFANLVGSVANRLSTDRLYPSRIYSSRPVEPSPEPCSVNA